MKNKEWWDNVLYYIILGACRFLAFFLFCFLYILSDIFFLVVYYLIGYRRSVVRDNLCQSFQKKKKKEILGIEKKFYHFFCDCDFLYCRAFCEGTSQEGRSPANEQQQGREYRAPVQESEES